MKGAKRIFTLLFFLLFLVAVVFTSSCSSPIGGLLAESPALDHIRAVPSRSLYDLNETINLDKDVKVIGVFGGVEKDINIYNVDNIIYIDEPNYSTGGVKEHPVYVPFSIEGAKDVVITYNNMEARYRIFVGDLNGKDPEGGSGSGGSGIIIIWE